MTEIEIFKEDDIEKYQNAESIYISAWIEFKVDLLGFEKLKRLRLLNKNHSNLDKLITLEELILSKIDKKKVNLSTLKNLKKLELVEGNIENLDFLKDYGTLKKLSLEYLYKLKDVSQLAAVSGTLEELVVGSCKKIEWKDELSKLKKLKKLTITGVTFENIAFVKNLPQLEHLAIVDSNILDGDISPAKDIKYVGIDNKRHYNYKFDYDTMKILPKK